MGSGESEEGGEEGRVAMREGKVEEEDGEGRTQEEDDQHHLQHHKQDLQASRSEKTNLHAVQSSLLKFGFTSAGATVPFGQRETQ